MRRTLALVAWLLAAVAVAAQSEVDELAAERRAAPVTLDGRVLFEVIAPEGSSVTAEQRAQPSATVWWPRRETAPRSRRARCRRRRVRRSSSAPTWSCSLLPADATRNGALGRSGRGDARADRRGGGRSLPGRPQRRAPHARRRRYGRGGGCRRAAALPLFAPLPATAPIRAHGRLPTARHRRGAHRRHGEARQRARGPGSRPHVRERGGLVAGDRCHRRDLPVAVPADARLRGADARPGDAAALRHRLGRSSRASRR